MHIWDPQARYLKADEAGSTSVGKKFQHVNSDLVSQFGHQYVPWQFAGLDIKRQANATLIRLPLRTAEQAKLSKLSEVLEYAS